MPGVEMEARLPDGRRVSVWQGGDPQGLPVFFLHGCPDSRRAAIPAHEQARALGVRLVAPSRPGYSSSDVPAVLEPIGERAHLEVADDVVELADLLEIGHFAVCGMSVGGPYAVATAARHPQRVSAVGVVEAPADVTRLGPSGHRDRLDEKARAFFRSLADIAADEAEGLVRPEFERYVAGIRPADPDDDAVASRWLATLPAADAALVAGRGPAEVARTAREAIGRTDGYLRDAVATFRAWQFDPDLVECPVFAWYGDGDDTYSPRNGEWYADRLGASYVLVPGASHLGTLLEHWSEVLTRLTSPRTTRS